MIVRTIVHAPNYIIDKECISIQLSATVHFLLKYIPQNMTGCMVSGYLFDDVKCWTSSFLKLQELVLFGF